MTDNKLGETNTEQIQNEKNTTHILGQTDTERVTNTDQTNAERVISNIKIEQMISEANMDQSNWPDVERNKELGASVDGVDPSSLLLLGLLARLQNGQESSNEQPDEDEIVLFGDDSDENSRVPDELKENTDIIKNSTSCRDVRNVGNSYYNKLKHNMEQNQVCRIEKYSIPF